METNAKRVVDELQKGLELSIVELVDAIIAHAYEAKASDIHIDPSDQEMNIRFRIDGVLQTMYPIPHSHYDEVICRIKVLANLRIDEQKAAQDGRFRITLPNGGENIDLRVSVVPTYYGESVVLRLLTDNSDFLTLSALGYRPEVCKIIERAIKRPHGMILVTGPTGSGKTTTLYTFLKMLSDDTTSLITIEDPIEYAIPGVTQIQTNPGRGLTFSSGLRSILRQDPDLIMVGEIRDHETAGIAVNTALTGHLLFSTLHTSDAVTTLPRLHDMGIESYLIASTVNLLIGQRLLRRNCPKCAVTKKFSASELASLKESLPENLINQLKEQKIGAGCAICSFTGFAGRISINEVLEVDEKIREAILIKASSATIKRLAIENGMVPMLEDGVMKVISGETTIEEVLRVIHE